MPLVGSFGWLSLVLYGNNIIPPIILTSYISHLISRLDNLWLVMMELQGEAEYELLVPAPHPVTPHYHGGLPPCQDQQRAASSYSS